MILDAATKSSWHGPFTRLAGVFPDKVEMSICDPRDDHPAPFPSEACAVSRATKGRQREFAAGRTAIRGAMRALGATPEPVPAGPDRAPRWPEGLTGSLSHCDIACVAAVARTRDMRSIGVDVEPDAPLASDLIPEIASLAERAWLSAQSDAWRGRLARLIFSAKECAYKCQYQVSGTIIGFDAFDVTPDPDSGQFEATLVTAVPGFSAGHRFHGRFVIEGGLIVTVSTLPQGPRWRMGSA